MSSHGNFNSSAYEQICNLDNTSPTVLEIGAGSFPSVQEEGAAFYDTVEVNYISLDLPSGMKSARNADLKAIAGNMNAMPLRDSSVDIALMRSVFGQFTGPGDSHIDDIRMWGLMELSRVLKPGGFGFIFEENTPWYEGYIEDYVQNVGMTVMDTVYKIEQDNQEEPRQEWIDLRGLFYSASNDRYMSRSYADEDFPKCIVLQKPEDAVMEEAFRSVTVNSHRLAEWRKELLFNPNIPYPGAIEKVVLFKTICTDQPKS